MSAAPPIARVAVTVAVGSALLLAAPAGAQLRPDPPGTAEVVRLAEPRIAPYLPESAWTADHRARVDRWVPEVAHRQCLPDRCCTCPSWSTR